METNSFVLEQAYEAYTPEDHTVWSLLYERQTKLMLTRASREFVRGFSMLSLDAAFVPRLSELNDRLFAAAGWCVVPVGGLIPSKDFMFMLQQKQFPITVSVRKMEELEFSELPDIFHDIFGHVPMLMNPLFTDFLLRYSTIALEFVDDEIALAALTRFYWFTLEMGLIQEDDVVKPYGGAIITSFGEIERVNDPAVPKVPFDIKNVLITEYDNLKLQKQYFVIDSFEQLFSSLELLRPAIVDLIVIEKSIVADKWRTF